MIDYDYYLKVNNNYSGIIDKHDMVSEMQDTMSEGLNDNFIDQFEIKIGMERYREKLTVNFEKDIFGILKYKQMKEAVYNSSAREMLTEIGAVKTGDYIKHVDKHLATDVRVYIVRNYVDRKHGRYDSTFILRCHRQLKWVTEDKVIHWYPVHFIDNKTMMMESTSQDLVLPKGVQQCFIQENEHTLKIEHGQRFISNGDVFRVVDMDKQTMNGLITLRLEKTEGSKYDNIELEIADYYRVFDREDIPIEPEPEPPMGYTLEIIGDNEIYIMFPTDFSVSVLDNGSPLPGLPVTWEVRNADGTNTPYASIESVDGYTCSVKPVNRVQNRFKEIVLKCSLTNDMSKFIEKTILLRSS